MKLKTHILAIVVFLVVLLILGYFLIRPENKKNDQNPYALELDKYYHVDSQLYCNARISSFKIKPENPVGICVDACGTIYVTSKQSLFKLDKNGTVISEIKLPGNAGSLSFGPNNKLYVSLSNRIAVLNTGGKIISEWQTVNPEGFISSIAVNENFVFAANSYTKKIYWFDFKGNIVKITGQKNAETPAIDFVVPSQYFDCAIGTDGHVWIVNPGRQLIVKLDSVGKEMVHWGKASTGPEGFCGCCNPSHLAILDDGSFITSEKGIPRVKKYDARGELQCVFNIKFPEGTTGLDICTMGNNIVYILEPNRQLIHKIELNNNGL